MARHEKAEGPRLYDTRRWRTLRLQVFARDMYTCQACGDLCTGQGRDDPEAPECDHKEPHRNDPHLMWDMGNLQTLHKRCHSIKTAIEDGGMTTGAQAHPDWLPKPSCPVVLVCGPAGAGKTTWANTQAQRYDEVIDLDECFRMVCGEHGHTANRKHLGSAMRLRNRLIANLAAKRQGTAYVIVSAPTAKEREWWAGKLNATVHVVRCPLAEIEARPISDRRKRLAREWFNEELVGEWRQRGLNAVGADGYPVR